MKIKEKENPQPDKFVSDIREKMGLSKVKMSKTMGVSVDTYFKWEAGIRSISAAPRRLLKILYVLYRLGILETVVRICDGTDQDIAVKKITIN